MDADRLLALLGLPSHEAALEAALAELATRRRPALDPHERDSRYDWVLVRRRGVELGFVDGADFQAVVPRTRRRGRAALLLFQVYFYTAREDVERFTGKLPFGIEWSDTRAQVRRRLQQHERFRRSYRRDAWELPGFWMTVTYKKGGRELDSIVCQLEPRPWPEEGRAQPNVGVADWLDLLGLPPSSPELRRRVRPLDLTEGIARAESEEDVDFGFECGLGLAFTPARNLKGVYRARLGRRSPETRVLGAIRFFRSRELDARAWTGELPFGLAFDDSQDAMATKIGREPDAQEDGDLDGYALWRFPQFSLHVLYDNMKNRLSRISVMAPGFD